MTDDARRARAISPVVLMAAIAAFQCAVAFTTPALSSPDAMKYAQTARNANRGLGFTYDMQHAANFAIYADGSRVPREHVFHEFPYVVHPWLASAAFRVFGESDRAMIALTTLLTLLTLPLVYGIARRLDPESAWIALALWGFNGQVVAGAIQGVTEPVFLVAFLAAVYAALDPKERWRAVAGAGAAAGVAYWTRDLAKVSVALLLPAVPWWRVKKRLGATVAALAAFAVGFFALSAASRATRYQPPPAENAVSIDPAALARLSGEHLPLSRRVFDAVGRSGLLQFSELYPGHTRERSLDAMRDSDVLDIDPGVLWRKWALNARVTGRNLIFDIFGPGLLAGFLLFGFVGRDAAPVARRAHRWSLALFGAHLFVCLALFSMSRYLIATLPFACVATAAVIMRAYRKWRSTRPALAWATSGAWIVAALFPFSFTASVPSLNAVSSEALVSARSADAESLRAFGEFLRANTTRSEVVVCDVPWISMWHGDRTSIWLPVDPENLGRLRRRAQVDAVVLTFSTREDMTPWRDWLQSMRDAGASQADGLTFVSGMRLGGSAVYLFKPVDNAPPPS